MSHVHDPCRRAARRETESEGADGEGEGESEGEADGNADVEMEGEGEGEAGSEEEEGGAYVDSSAAMRFLKGDGLRRQSGLDALAIDLLDICCMKCFSRIVNLSY